MDARDSHEAQSPGARPPLVWRPRAWVRLIAAAVPVGVGLSLLFPQVLNPAWTEGTPTSELPYALAFLVVGLILAWSALVSKIEVTADRVRVVNPLASRSILRTSVADVRPGSLGVQFVTADGGVVSALAVQSTAWYRGARPRWAEVAELVTGRTFWPFNEGRTGNEGALDTLADVVATYCSERDYSLTRSDDDELLVFHVEVPEKGRVELTTDGEAFTLRFPGGYRWAEFADPAEPDDARRALDDQLDLINAYGDSATVEAIATRRWRRPRPELRLSNGAILRSNGRSKGPPTDPG